VEKANASTEVCSLRHGCFGRGCFGRGCIVKGIWQGKRRTFCPKRLKVMMLVKKPSCGDDRDEGASGDAFARQRGGDVCEEGK